MFWGPIHFILESLILRLFREPHHLPQEGSPITSFFRGLVPLISEGLLISEESPNTSLTIIFFFFTLSLTDLNP